MFETPAKLIQKYRKKKMPLKNTYDIMRPINIMSNVMGFRIFEYPRGHSRPRLSFLYMMILVCFYYGGSYYHELLSKTIRFSNLSDTMITITRILQGVSIFVTLTVGLHQTKSLKQSMRRIHDIDMTLRALGSPPSFNIIYKKMMAMLSYFIFNMIVCRILAQIYIIYLPFTNVSNRTLQEVLSSILHVYGDMVKFIMIIEFLVIVSCIESEFQRANDLLKDYNVLPLSSIAMELFDQEKSNDPLSMNKFLFPSSNKLFTLLPSSQRLRSHLQLTSHAIIRSRRLLETIRQIHLELYRVSKTIDMIYGLQISMDMGLLILNATYDIYTLYDSYRDGANKSTFLVVRTIVTFFMCFTRALKITSINYTCGKMSQEANITNEIIYTFYGQCTDFGIQEEMEMFSLQMKQCRQSYSAFSLYSLNCKNICSAIGIIITYVIFMVQEATK